MINKDAIFLENTYEEFNNMIYALKNGDERLFVNSYKVIKSLNPPIPLVSLHKVVINKITTINKIFDQIDMFCLSNNEEMVKLTVMKIPDYCEDIISCFVAYVSALYQIDTSEAIMLIEEQYPTLISHV